MSEETEILRPDNMSEYIGQEALKARIRVYIDAALNTGRPMEHMLFAAPPGVGKTSLAKLIAKELTDDYLELQMPMDEKRFAFRIRDFYGVVLLDELHAAPKSFQEMLLPALHDQYIQTKDGRKIDVSGITFLGATTEPQGIIKPLWDRFKLQPSFADYTDDEMRQILESMAKRLGFELPAATGKKLARAAGGTPRLASNLVLAARNLNDIGRPVTAEAVLDLAEVDPDGLSSRHIDYLRTLFELGEQAGLRNICTMLQLSQPVIEDLERLLLKRRLIALQPGGRELLEPAYAKIPDLAQRRSTRRVQPNRKSA